MLYYSMCVSLSISPGPSSVSLKCSQVVSASASPEMLLVEKDPEKTAEVIYSWSPHFKGFYNPFDDLILPA